MTFRTLALLPEVFHLVDFCQPVGAEITIQKQIAPGNGGGDDDKNGSTNGGSDRSANDSGNSNTNSGFHVSGNGAEDGGDNGDNDSSNEESDNNDDDHDHNGHSDFIKSKMPDIWNGKQLKYSKKVRDLRCALYLCGNKIK